MNDNQASAELKNLESAGLVERLPRQDGTPLVVYRRSRSAFWELVRPLLDEVWPTALADRGTANADGEALSPAAPDVAASVERDELSGADPCTDASRAPQTERRALTGLSPDAGQTILDQALAACAVRVDVGQSHAGSGFFVAPGVVVTCSHVLNLARLSSAEANTPISIVSPRGSTHQVVEIREISDASVDDLAILRVEPAADHPCALLDPELRTGDQVVTFGYPRRRPHGALTSLEAVGRVGGGRTLSLAHGQIQPGMSGSPVLNSRTGTVCGILNRRRDVPHTRGGYVIPVESLFKLNPALELLNRRHHEAHASEWVDLLPLRQRSRFAPLRNPLSGDPASRAVFVISLTLEDDAWKVTAQVHTYDPARSAWIAGRAYPAIDVSLDSMRGLVARVFRDWASPGPTVRGRVGQGEQIRLLGEILSSVLFRDRVGEQFDALLSEAEAEAPLEVALHFAVGAGSVSEDFVQLPWEHLYLPAKGERREVYVAREPRLAFVRTMSSRPQTHSPSGRASILVVAVKPPASPGAPPEDADLATRVDRVVAGLNELATELDETIELEVLEGPDPARLAERIEGGAFDVIHYVGYGRFEAGSDLVALGGFGQDPVMYADPEVVAKCTENRHPVLFILQLCGAQEAVPADLSAFAAPMLARGSEAVIAHQFPIAYSLTQAFNREFYTRLAQGDSVEVATQAARRWIWMMDPEAPAFISPAVFVRNPGGLRLISTRGQASKRMKVDSRSSHA